MDNIPGNSPADEARLFEDIIRAHPDLPEGVHRVEYRLGWDHAGTPAVWFVLKAEDDLKPSKAKVEAINDFGNELISAAFLSDTERWGYIDIETE
jgi:hypothetical protein